jgi:hemerythrin-like domain-containing protein
MQPIGPLMHEHRDIERLITILRGEEDNLAAGKEPQSERIEEIIALMRGFADACHHGKEEDILFRDLGNKDLSDDHRRIMEELVQEHAEAREMVKKLEEFNNEFKSGKRDAITNIQAELERIAGHYSRHITKEDTHFFHPCMDYFSPAERDAMLEEFDEFERSMPHEDYLKRIEVLEKGHVPPGV